MATQLTNLSEHAVVVPQIASFKSMTASEAARIFTLGSQPAQKSTGFSEADEALATQVMANLKSQGIDADVNLVRGMVAQVAKSGAGELIQKATDPVILPQPYVTPIDFAAQYPQPLDPTEIN